MSALIVHPSTRRPLPFPAEGYPHGLSLEAWPRNVALKRTQGQLWEREAERQVSGQDRPAYVIAVYNAAIKRTVPTDFRILDVGFEGRVIRAGVRVK